MKLENWMDEEDRFLKQKEIDIHHQYHEKLSEAEITEEKLFGDPTRKIRIGSLKLFLEKTGNTFHGKILEVGAGDGWCSAYIGKNYQYDSIHTMEINKAAVEKLIPKVFQAAKIDTSKSTLVLGSFNNIKLKNHFNFVVVMGALHHSANLYTTFKSIYESLVPGGWLVAQEPSMDNHTLNKFYHDREDQEVEFKRMVKVKNSDRTDVFYRECEYRTAAFHAGLDFYSESLVPAAPVKPKFSLFKKAQPAPVIDKNKPQNILIYAQKPMHDYPVPVTNWEERLAH